MREILFRAKTIDNEPRWVEGYYSFNGTHWIEHKSIKCPGYWETNPIDPETLGQFTGLTDKNGVKIFEGDILKISRRSDALGTYYFPDIPSPYNVVVRWGHCAWMWETLTEDKYYITFPDAWCHYTCEVIGNIHDKRYDESKCDFYDYKREGTK